MNNKKKNLIFFLLFISMIVLTTTAMLVYGADDTEPTFTIGLSDGLKYLDKITSKVWFGEDRLGFKTETNYLINNFIQAIFWLPKFIFRIFATFYQITSSISRIVSTYITYALDFSSTIFVSLFGSGYGSLGSVILGVIVIRSLIALVNNGSFFKELLKGLAIVLAVMVIFTKTNDGYFIEKLYNRTDDAVKSLTGDLRKSFDDSSLSSEVGIVSEDGLGDYYFEETIWKAYKYMNFDKADDVTTGQGSDKKIIEGAFQNSEGEEFTEDQMTSIVFYESGNDKFKVTGDEEIKKFVGSGDKVKNYMMKGNWGRKTDYIVASLIDIVVLGVVVNIIGMTKLILGLLIILLLLLGVFSALMYIFYPRSGALTNWTKRLFIALFLANFMGLIGVVVIWLYNLLGIMLARVGIQSPIVLATAKGFILWLTYKYRSFLIGAITGNGLRVANNSRLKGLSPFSKKENKDKQDNKMSKLAHARQSARAKLGTAVRGTALVGAGAKVMAMNRLKKSSVGHFVGNKMKQSKVLDVASVAGDGLDVVGRKISSLKDRAMAKVYDISAEGLTDVEDRQRQESFRDKAKNYREQAGSKSGFKSTRLEKRKAQRRAIRTGELRFANRTNLDSFRAKNQKEMALKNKELIQKGLKRRNRIATERRNVMREFDKLPHTKQRLQKLQSQRQSSKPNINRSRFYKHQNDMLAKPKRIEEGKRLSAQIKSERAEESLRQKRVNRVNRPQQVQSKAIQESVHRFRPTLSQPSIKKSPAKSTKPVVKKSSGDNPKTSKNVSKKSASIRPSAKNQPVIKGVKATINKQEKLSESSKASNIRMRKNK